MRKGWLGLALAGMLLACGDLTHAPAAAVQEEDRPANAPDFSAVTTKAAANRLVREGKLVKIHFFPTELGGQEDPLNIGYTTPEAAEARTRLIGTLRRFADEELIDKMEVEPDYRGTSIIPTRLRFKAWHSMRGGAPFEGMVEVW